jgi:hypothetical protein
MSTSDLDDIIYRSLLLTVYQNNQNAVVPRLRAVIQHVDACTYLARDPSSTYNKHEAVITCTWYLAIQPMKQIKFRINCRKASYQRKSPKDQYGRPIRSYVGPIEGQPTAWDVEWLSEWMHVKQRWWWAERSGKNRKSRDGKESAWQRDRSLTRSVGNRDARHVRFHYVFPLVSLSCKLY